MYNVELFFVISIVLLFAWPSYRVFNFRFPPNLLNFIMFWTIFVCNTVLI